MKQVQYDKLEQYAHEMQRRSLEQVSVADLIRDAIDIYLEGIEDDDYEGGVGPLASDSI